MHSLQQRIFERMCRQCRQKDVYGGRAHTSFIRAKRHWTLKKFRVGGKGNNISLVVIVVGGKVLARGEGRFLDEVCFKVDERESGIGRCFLVEEVKMLVNFIARDRYC